MSFLTTHFLDPPPTKVPPESSPRKPTTAACLTLLLALGYANIGGAAPPIWARHVIDDSSRGADGVRLKDLNQDGRLDIVTGWEEGGIVRVYLQPSRDRIRDRWPAVTVGAARDVEDAVAADLDNDGQLDVISCTEGNTQTVFLHWGPETRRYLEPEAWQTQAIPASRGQQRWMYCVPLQMDGVHGEDLLVGSKGSAASIGWWEAPVDPRDVNAWTYHRLLPAGWIMSLYALDMDGDGDQDILFTDRKGNSRGVRWLEKTSADPRDPRHWKLHTIGATDREVMFLTVGDLDGDGHAELVVPTWNRTLDIFSRHPSAATGWRLHRTPLPFGLARGKSAALADFTLDGQIDIALTARSVPVDGPAVALMQHQGSPLRDTWRSADLGGPAGSKFDLLEPLDLDGDGDLDLITCEEIANLGVIWYENPQR